MHPSPACLGLVLALVVPGGLAAQQAQEADTPPTLRLSFYQCDMSELDPTMEQIETMEMPIWNELVAEGMVMSYGHFVHAWASEWNVGIYTVAASIEDVLAATEEFGSRMEERHPDAALGLNEVCPAHRDGFYLMGPSTDDPEGGGSN